MQHYAQHNKVMMTEKVMNVRQVVVKVKQLKIGGLIFYQQKMMMVHKKITIIIIVN